MRLCRWVCCYTRLGRYWRSQLTALYGSYSPMPAGQAVAEAGSSAVMAEAALGYGLSEAMGQRSALVAVLSRYRHLGACCPYRYAVCPSRYRHCSAPSGG